MITVASLLAQGLHLPPPDVTPVPVPAGTACAISGVPVTVGYPVQKLVTGATAEFLGTYRGDVHGYVSEAVARCIRSANPRAGNPCARSHLVFEDGTYYGPLISRESALAQGRPCWSDLVRTVWPARAGERCLVLLTTDTKKRLWPLARVTTLGAATSVFVHDGASQVSGPRVLCWPDLLTCLDLVEAVYAQGVSKTQIATSVYRATKVLARVGYLTLADWERRIAPWRSHPVFTVALLIAQREEEVP